MDETRSALIIASDQYTDPGLRRLQAPASDARALASVLRDPGIGGFEVRTLLNEPAHVITLAVEEFFADRRPGDLLLVHFSGHGVKDEDGELYFAASNTVLGRLGATAVAAEFVSRRMSRSRSRRVVLLLDCCYAGAFERGLVARAGVEMGIGQQFGGRGRAVITASSAMEYAFEAGELTDDREVPPSVFTSALVHGLETGEADRDQDGMVGLDELYDYVYDKVRAATPNQTPGKWAFGVEGELYIARRSRPVTTPAPLPPELVQAIDSPLAGIRAGAVQELERVLRGSHAGMALAARRALEQLTEDDSRAVAAAAAAAIGAPTPVPPVPPPPELTLSETVAVDTSTAGGYDGTVTVDSDSGTAIIPVQARVDLAPPRAFETAAAAHSGPVPETSAVPTVTKTAPAPTDPGQKPPRAARGHRGGRGIRRRPVIVLTSAITIVVIGLVVAITTISSAPPTPSTTARWTYTTGSTVASVPAVANGTVYVGGDDSKVYALDAATGHLRWSYTTEDPYNDSLAVADGAVYVGSWDIGTNHDQVYALDAATGSLRWSYTTAGSFNSGATVTVAGGTVYLGDVKLYALDTATGHLRWSYTSGVTGYYGPAVSGGTVYVGGWDHKVYALDTATGHLRWSYTTGDSMESGPAVVGGTVYIGGWDHKVYALDTATGHLRWSYTTGDGVNCVPAVADGTVYIGSVDGKVYALDAATGNLRWSFTTGVSVYSGPVVSGGTVYVGSNDHHVYALDAATGRPRWAYITGERVVAGPAVSGGTVYIGSYDDNVYALDAGGTR